MLLAFSSERLGASVITLAEASVELRAKTGLRMPDCCVLYAAGEVGARTIATFDERLMRVATEQGLVSA